MTWDYGWGTYKREKEKGDEMGWKGKVTGEKECSEFQCQNSANNGQQR